MLVTQNTSSKYGMFAIADYVLKPIHPIGFLLGFIFMLEGDAEVGSVKVKFSLRGGTSRMSFVHTVM